MALVNFTNTYACMHILERPTYARPEDGSWQEVDFEEMCCFLAVILYFGLVRVADCDKYWSVRPPYNGLWARRMIRRERFKALRSFFQCSEPGAGDPQDRLRKVRFLYDEIRILCGLYWQPGREISIDERMIKFKGRHHMKQYIKKKPTKWGFKSYTLCDSTTAYMCQFELYTGKANDDQGNGATHAVVMRLVEPFLDQGYQLFTDNYYTSQALAEALVARQTALVGTVQAKRVGFPDRLKNVKAMQRYGSRGDMRFERNGHCLYVQWLDKRVVTVLSTIHSATAFVNKNRWVKVNGEYEQQVFRKPIAVESYNTHMGGVDIFDQLASSYRLLRRSKKFTKTIFYDLVEIATVNSFKLMVKWMVEHPGAIQRGRSFTQYQFRENLICQLSGIEQDEDPPISRYRRAEKKDVHTNHTPIFSEVRANCAVCWKLRQQRMKSVFACAECRNRQGHPVHLCIKPDRECFRLFHSAEYDPYR